MKWTTRTEQAFRFIQRDEVLYRKWNKAKTETERTNMLVEVAFNLGYEQALADNAGIQVPGL